MTEIDRNLWDRWH